MRSAGYVGVVGHGADAEVEFGVALGVGIQAGGAGEHGAFAGDVGGVGQVAAAFVDHEAVFDHAGEVFDVAQVQGRVHGQAGGGAAEAVVFGGVEGVVPGGEALQLRPADPAAGEGAFVAAGFEFGGGLLDFGPGFGRLFGVEAGGLEGVLVVVEDGGGAVEGQAEHVPLSGGVVAGDGGHVGGGVEVDAGFFHDFGHGFDGVFAGHHGGGAHFKHLQDVRRVAGAEGGDGGGHGFAVLALVGGHDFVVLLACVELGGQVVDPFAQRAGHGVPPVDFGWGVGGQGEGGAQGQGDGVVLDGHGVCGFCWVESEKKGSGLCGAAP